MLRKNHKRSTPTRILYYDVETKKQIVGNEEHHRLKLGWTCYVERRFRNTKDTELWSEWHHTRPLCEYIDSKAKGKSALFLFGHNIYFDLQCSDFFHYFTLWGWQLRFVYDQGLSFILIIKKDSRTIKVCSTTNYFPESLKKLGDMIDLPKLEVDFDTVDETTLSTYCKRDVEIIKQIMEDYFHFIRSYDLGRFGLTRASQSLNAYRHRFMEKRIYLHSERKIQELEKNAYMGGRVECFHIGEVKGGPFLSLDINSMYPHIMKNELMPVRLLDYRENENPASLYGLFERYNLIAKVVIETDRPVYAVRHDKKLVFPVGTFTAYMCSVCLQDALAHGEIHEILEVAIYEGAHIFNTYVDFFYDLRNHFKAQGNCIYEQFCKYLLNSLYGKFAQWRPIVETELNTEAEGYWRRPAIDLVSGRRWIEYKLFNTIVREVGKEIGRNSFIAISAHITEWARYLLHELIATTGYERVLYCDTDSIKIRKSDLPYVKYRMHKKELGALKVESETGHLTIYGPKSYEDENTHTFKGIPKSAKCIAPGQYSYAAFPKMKTHMTRGITRFYIVRNTEKQLRVLYDKGDVHPDGHVTPLLFAEPYSLA